jgi:hypothetical protein
MTLSDLIKGSKVCYVHLIVDESGTPDESYWYVVMLEVPDQEQVQTIQVTVTYDDQGEHIYDFMVENGFDPKTPVIRVDNRTGNTTA